MLKAMGEKEITYEALLETIEAMNVKRDGRLGNRTSVKMCTSVDPSKCNVKTYCEDQRLSMLRPGMCFKAIDLTCTELEPLDMEDIEFLLESAAGFMIWRTAVRPRQL